ncbi:MAG: adenylate/guanylate cyclase domain-containing protein [Treponema sp.]|nr:adenylate/guanylate cyclase domain-containing protein [Treponema sp.]
MQFKTKTIARMSWIYGLIIIIANIIAVLVPNVISDPLGESPNQKLWLDYLANTHASSFSLIAAFLVPTLICIFYSESLMKSEEKLLSNLSEIPSVYSLSSVIGWNLYYFIEIPFVIHAKITLGISIKYILISSWAFALISGMTAWTISYLAIELLNRTVLLPQVFPQGHIKHTKHSVYPRFSHLLIFCFMVSSVFPIGLLMASHISLQIQNGLPIQTSVVIISIMFLLFALTITISLSKIIITPLGKLTQAAERIKDGDYKTKVSIVTADELGTLADSFNDMADSLAEKEFMRDTFGKVVDPEVRDYLMKDGGLSLSQLGGQTRQVTVLFCDIRSFTAMSEKMSAEEVVSLLNKYFTALGKCITKNHGIINKYIGDAIMAIFGAPINSKNSALDALKAALDMRQALSEVNKDFEKQGKPSIRFGIGIHTGPVFAGTIGAENRMEYTVIGDTVNTASRLESLCKTYKTDLLLSQETVNQTGLPLEDLIFVDDAQIRGKEETKKVYSHSQKKS